METSYERELGEVQIRLAHLESSMKDAITKLDAIQGDMDTAKGGWRAIMLISGISATLGALLSKYVPFLMMKAH